MVSRLALGLLLLCAGCAAPRPRPRLRDRWSASLWTVSGPCLAGERPYRLTAHLDPVGGAGGGGAGIARVWSGAKLGGRYALALGRHAWPDGLALVAGFRLPGAPVGRTLLVVHDAGLMFGQANTQFYGLTDRGRVVLLRRQDAAGALLPTIYTPDELVGTPPPAWTRARLLRALQGEDAAAALEALNWLGGGPPERRDPLWAELTRAPAVRRATAELTRSGTPWIAEAAAQALKRAPGA